MEEVRTVLHIKYNDGSNSFIKFATMKGILLELKYQLKVNENLISGVQIGGDRYSYIEALDLIGGVE